MTFLRPLDSDLDDATLTQTTHNASLNHGSVGVSVRRQTLTKTTAFIPSLSSLSVYAALVVFTQIAYCSASPAADSGTATQPASYSEIVARDQNGTVSPKVYIPIAAAFIILLILGGLSWYKTGFKDGIMAMTRTPHTATGTTRRSGNAAGGNGASRRELTAAQLTGVQETGAGAAGATAGAAGRRGRRGRRPRRTPSQMSVTSLPEYNKEPGDEELVIFRGHDAEDATIPVDLARHTDTPDSSHDDSTLQYSYTMNTTLDTSTNNLLQPGYADARVGGGGVSRDSLAEDDDDERNGNGNNDNGGPRNTRAERDGDAESGQSSERRSLMVNGERASVDLDAGGEARRNLELDIEARGDAPAYFEVVGDGDAAYAMGGHRRQVSMTAAGAAAATPTQVVDLNATVTRRSGFRTFLNRMSLVGSGSATSNTHPPLPSTATDVPSSTQMTTTSTAVDGLPLHHTRNTSALSVYPPSPGPDPRTTSRLSTYTTNNNGDTHTGVNSRHRANTSTSTNASRLSLFRPLSRQRSTNTLNMRSGTPSSFSHSQLNLHNMASRSQLNLNLTSPSQQSLHSLISSPLPHTLTRTEITYPAGGPTAEQIKALSGRESVGRWGVPYGEEAVRWARGGAAGSNTNLNGSDVNLVGGGNLNASRSVLSLSGVGGSRSNVNLNLNDEGYEVPPPGFDEVVGNGGLGAGVRGRGHERGESTGSLGVPVPSRLGVDAGAGWNNAYTNSGANTTTTLAVTATSNTPSTNNMPTTLNDTGIVQVPRAITIEPPSRGVSRRNTAEVYERHEDEKEREGGGDRGEWEDDEKKVDEHVKEKEDKGETRPTEEKNGKLGENEKVAGVLAATPVKSEVDSKAPLTQREPQPQSQPQPKPRFEHSVNEFGAIVDTRSSRSPGFSATAPSSTMTALLSSPPTLFPASAHTVAHTNLHTHAHPESYRSESRTSTYSTATMDSFRTAESYETVGEGYETAGEGRGESRMSVRGGERRMSVRGGERNESRNESRLGERNESRSTYYTDFEDDNDDFDDTAERTMRLGGVGSGSDEDGDTDDDEGNGRSRRRDTVIGHSAQSVNRKRDTVIAAPPTSSYAVGPGRSSTSTTRAGAGVVVASGGVGGAVLADNEDDDDEPTTPKLGTMHLQEASDATVVQRI